MLEYKKIMKRKKNYYEYKKDLKKIVKSQKRNVYVIIKVVHETFIIISRNKK
jgi:hypothetical protein